MKRTPYTVKAQRARKAWKRLKEQNQTKANNQPSMTIKSTKEYTIPELDHDE